MKHIGFLSFGHWTPSPQSSSGSGRGLKLFWGEGEFLPEREAVQVDT